MLYKHGNNLWKPSNYWYFTQLNVVSFLQVHHVCSEKNGLIRGGQFTTTFIISKIWPYKRVSLLWEWPYKRGSLLWEWPYKRGSLLWEWPYKRGSLLWEWPYKRGSLWWEWPYKRGDLSWGGHFTTILLSQCIWNLAL